MLQKQHLSRAGAVVKVSLRFLALLAAKGRIGKDDIVSLGRILKQAAVAFLPGESVAVPQVRVVDAVQRQVSQCDGINQVFLFPSVESAFPQRFQLFRAGGLAQAGRDMLVALRQKAARAAARIIHSFAQLRVNHLRHGPDHFPGRKELAAVVPFFAHFQQQPFIDLRQRKYMSIINRVVGNLVNLVQHILKVALGINADALHAGHNFADDFLRRRRVALAAQPFQMGQQLAVDETEQRVGRRGLQFQPLVGLAGGQRFRRRAPVPPAVGRRQRRPVRSAQNSRLVGFLLLPLVQNA